MRAFGILGGIFVAAAGALTVATLVSKPPQAPLNQGPAPQIEFRWSLPDAGQASSRVAIRGSELQTEITPLRHRRRHRDETAARGAKHHHDSSEPADLSASTVSEGSAPASPSSRTPAKFELAAVEERLKKSLSGELYSDFQLFLYVSKAVTGPLAQRMYVFRKGPDGAFNLLYDWPVSTGRERAELNDEGLELSTFTPTGRFKLDPRRFYRHHTSAEWHEPMPYAMFFDWKERGTPTGLAIHAATGGDINALGTRASAGCVRLSPEAAETLFRLIHDHYRGLTPRFAVNHRTGTTSADGLVLHDAKGRAEMVEGYKALVVIDNYGGENLVAAMY